MNLLTPNRSSDVATPANSAMMLVRFRKTSSDHDEERDAQAELLANQIGQPFARHRAHPRAHFLRDDQRHA